MKEKKYFHTFLGARTEVSAYNRFFERLFYAMFVLGLLFL